MHKRTTTWWHAGCALALVIPASAARADAASDIEALRKEIASLRSSYEERLQSLEQRLKAAESTNATAPGWGTAAAGNAAPPPSVAVAPPASSDGGGAQSGAGGGFNPSISLILSGLYARTSQDPSTYRITGFALPPDAEIGPGKRGFSLSESELGFAASIDPWWRGAANISVHGDDTVSVEEAYVQTTALGNAVPGLTLKAGRFYSAIGYLNAQHSHTWDFVDNPLAYQALLGTQYGDDGVQASWLAPTDQYIELGMELGRGRSYPGGDNDRNGAGMVALTAHTGGDIGASHNWRAGVSVLNAKANGQPLVGLADPAGAPVASAFSGSTRVWVADAVWKWAPNGNATRTNFKLQAEYLRSTRSGDLTFDPDGVGALAAYRAVQSGWYVQGVYQFMPRWRVGARTERLNAGTPDYGANAARYALTDYAPSKNSLMLDYSASEFSRIRLQIARDRAREGVVDNQLFVQYQMSLGAHGAHSY